MGQPSRVWDRFANRYAKSPVADEEAYQTKLQVTREYLRPEMQVLEFGCGTGSTAIAQAPYAKHITAIDFSEKMLAIAQAKADAANIENVTFRRTAIEDFVAGDKAFDMVMGHSILHLLDDRRPVLSAIHKMLNPGGIFISSTVCIGGRFHPARLLIPVGRFLGLLPLVRFFPVTELANSITGAGFEIVHQWQPKKDSAVFIVAKKK